MLHQALFLLGGGFLVGLLAGIALVRSEATPPRTRSVAGGSRARGQAARPSAPCQCSLCRGWATKRPITSTENPSHNRGRWNRLDRQRPSINGGRWL